MSIKRTPNRLALVCGILGLAFGCGDDAPPADSGMADSGTVDTSVPDTCSPTIFYRLYGLDVGDTLAWTSEPTNSVPHEDATNPFATLLQLPYVDGGLEAGDTTVLLESFPFGALSCARSVSFDGNALTIGGRHCIDAYPTAQPVYDGPHTYALVEVELDTTPTTDRRVELLRLVPDTDPVGEDVRAVQDPAAITSGGESDYAAEIVGAFYGAFQPGDPPPCECHLAPEQLTTAPLFGLDVGSIGPAKGPTILRMIRGYTLASDLVVDFGRATVVTHQPGATEHTIAPALTTLSCTLGI